MTAGTNIDVIVKTLDRNRNLSAALSVPIIRAEIPLGYYVNPEKPDEALADSDKFELLRKARRYLKDSPYAEVASWLTKSGLPISHNGLHKLMMNRPPLYEHERTAFLNGNTGT